MAKLEKIGYGQLELNQVAFPRDGRIEAQCALDTADFTEAKPAENGMILVVDNVNRLIKLPEGEPGEIYALNYSSEHLYDERTLGSLRHFRLVPGEFYPRLGYLSVGDKFTTNTIELDGKELTAGFYAIPNTDGYWKLAGAGYPTDAPLVVQVIKVTTMPDGQKAAKLQVVKA
jgi:hypothetical protein